MRQHIPDLGLYYIWELPFLLIGIYVLIQRKRSLEIFSLLLWLALLLPASITRDDIPNVYRTVVIVPYSLFITAIGIATAFNFLKKRKIAFSFMLVLLCLIGGWEFMYGIDQYAVHATVHHPWYRNYASKPLVESISKDFPSYKRVLLPKDGNISYIHFLFYTKFDHTAYVKSGSHMDEDWTGFGRYTFIPRLCTLLSTNATITPKEMNTLYVNSGTCPVPPRAEVLKTIYWKDNTVAYRILRYIPAASSLQK